jgi:hypothetical protein
LWCPNQRAGLACNTHGRHEKKVYNVLIENSAGKRRFGDVGLSGRIMLKWIIK